MQRLWERAVRLLRYGQSHDFPHEAEPIISIPVQNTQNKPRQVTKSRSAGYGQKLLATSVAIDQSSATKCSLKNAMVRSQASLAPSESNRGVVSLWKPC